MIANSHTVVIYAMYVFFHQHMPNHWSSNFAEWAAIYGVVHPPDTKMFDYNFDCIDFRATRESGVGSEAEHSLHYWVAEERFTYAYSRLT